VLCVKKCYFAITAYITWCLSK